MIVVKSIKEKPKECRGCRLLDESTYDCLINSESPAYTTLEGQYEHCPIEEHPDINVGNMDTTTHDPIPAKTGKNDGDGTSGDCISRRASLEKIRTMQTYKLFAGDDMILIDKAEVQTELMDLPSAQPNIIRCKDCKHWNPQLKTANGNGLGSCDFHNVALVTSEGFCYWAEKRGEQDG